MAFPDDHQNLASNAADAPADPASTGWMAKVSTAVAAAITAIKSVGEQLVAVKAKGEANETAITEKASLDLSNVERTDAITKIVGNLQNVDVGKLLKVSAAAPPEITLSAEPNSVSLSALIYTGWTPYSDGDNIVIELIKMISTLPAAAIFTGLEYSTQGYTYQVSGPFGTQTRQGTRYRSRIKYRTYS